MNDNSNDELFRRAAEHYPLKTDSSDWQSMHQKLETAGDTEEAPTPARKRNFRPLWLLLLLLPLKLFEPELVHHNAAITGNEGHSEISKNRSNDTSLPLIPGRVVGQQPVSLPNAGVPGSGAGLTETDNRISYPVSNDIDEKRPGKERNGTSRPQQQVRHVLAGSTTIQINSPGIETAEDRHPVPSATTENTEPGNGDGSSGSEEGVPVAPDKKETLKVPDEEAGTKSNDATKAPVGKKKNKRLYIGVVAGPDFSTIKMQAIKKTGINFGFVAGYKINSRFTVEAGFLKDKKRYSTDGKYFDTKNVYMPGYADILYVDGECNMFEVPLNIYYTLRPRPSSSFFASAGLSSYFMQSESYVYDVEHYGVRYPRYASYKNKSTSLAAMANFSVGYQRKLGKICDIRIEPYVKLPINKVGTGSLPIQSAGVMIGITKTIF